VVRGRRLLRRWTSSPSAASKEQRSRKGRDEACLDRIGFSSNKQTRRKVSKQVGDASERTFGRRIATGSVSKEPENQRHTEQHESRPYDAPECDRPGLAAYQPEVINKQSAYDHENR
jgi:hypothetical protein